MISGPQDAAGGLLKRQADMAVLRGNISINNAKDLYEYAVSNLVETNSICKRRIFRYVESIPRDKNLYFKPISNIRSFHQVLVRNSFATNQILLRELSCFTCDSCADQKYEECSNLEKAGKFENVVVKHENGRNIQQAPEPMPSTETLQELVSAGQVIAVLADDNACDYYLLKVTRVRVLNEETTDAWGISFPPGSEVIQGHYYNSKRNNPLTYKLIPRKTALVPSLAVVYICSEIQSNVDIILSEDIHLNILQSIEEKHFK